MFDFRFTMYHSPAVYGWDAEGKASPAVYGWEDCDWIDPSTLA